MFRILFLLLLLAGSIQLNIEGARIVPPRIAVERFFYQRAIPVFHWVNARVIILLKERLRQDFFIGAKG
jgi:hypothetical protein